MSVSLIILLFMFSLYYNSIYCSPAVNPTTTSVIQESVNSLCRHGTDMPVVTGGVSGVMGVIILTLILVIVVLLLRQSTKGKANKR